jgi:HPt (histidine-containing phosphotransfer) domain-containing protein
MDDYVSKPVRAEELADALSRCRPLNDTPREPMRRNLPPAQTALPTLDLDTLNALRALGEGDSADVLSELITLFLDDTPRLLAEARAAVEAGDAQVLQRAAHTLKSSGASLGALPLSALCAELETMGRESQLEGAKEKAARVEAEYERVKTALAAQCAGELAASGMER